MMPKYSIVIPVFNEEKVIDTLYEELTRVMEGLDGETEIVFINDGSVDKSPRLLRELAAKDKRVKVLNFSRNFGHQIAITAGIDYAKGDAVITIDADLQDPPELILTLVSKWKEGYDVVYAVRKKRSGEGLFKLITASLFYRIMKRIAHVDMPVDSGDFRLMDRKVVNTLKQLKERNRFLRGLVSWVGYRQTGIEYARRARYAGDTKYPFWKMLNFSFDGITSFSFLPLRFALVLGLIVSFMCFLSICFAAYVAFLTDAAVPGWTSLMVAISFFCGIQLLTIGLIGEYVGRTFDEIKGRPLYIIAESINAEEE